MDVNVRAPHLFKDGTPLLTHGDLVKAFAAVGLAEGDGVFVHASLGSLGWVVGGARSVISALIACVGREGLIAMPAFSADASMPYDIAMAALSRSMHQRIADAVPGHDARLSDCRSMGAVAEMFRHWEGTYRSAHPCVSVAAWGENADAYLQSHDLAWACGPGTPLDRLRTRTSMKVMLLGVDWSRCSAFHTAETLVETRRTKTRLFKHGGQWLETPDVADDNGRLFPIVGQAFERAGSVSKAKVGGATVRLCDYDMLIRFATQELAGLTSAVGATDV